MNAKRNSRKPYHQTSSTNEIYGAQRLQGNVYDYSNSMSRILKKRIDSFSPKTTITCIMSNKRDYPRMQVTNDRFVIDNTYPYSFSLAMAAIFAVPFCIFLYGLLTWDGEYFLLKWIAVYPLLAGFGITVLYFLINPKKKVMFDRLTGFVCYNRMWKKDRSISFNGSSFAIRNDSSKGRRFYKLAIIHKNDAIAHTIYDAPLGKEEDFIIEFWALIVWYMDKNRPLPPGIAFDRYREQDYERRKAAGFPLPLYPSAVETPEWEGAKAE